MRYKNIKIFSLLILTNMTFASLAGAQEVQLLSGISQLAKTISDSGGFSGLLGTILNIVIALAAIWAVIEISYLGAKYALVDSFTGKKSAIKDIWPVTYGLIALLGVYIFFNQINPDILKLKVVTPEAGNINLNTKLKPIKDKQGVTAKAKCYFPGSDGSCKYKSKAEYKNAQKQLEERYGVGTDLVLSVSNFCKNNGDFQNVGQCSEQYTLMRRCLIQLDSNICEKVDKKSWKSIKAHIEKNGTYLKKQFDLSNRESDTYDNVVGP